MDFSSASLATENTQNANITQFYPPWTYFEPCIPSINHMSDPKSSCIWAIKHMVLELNFVLLLFFWKSISNLFLSALPDCFMDALSGSLCNLCLVSFSALSKLKQAETRSNASTPTHTRYNVVPNMSVKCLLFLCIKLWMAGLSLIFQSPVQTLPNYSHSLPLCRNACWIINDCPVVLSLGFGSRHQQRHILANNTTVETATQLTNNSNASSSRQKLQCSC